MKTFFEIQRNLLNNLFSETREIFSEIDFDERLI
jgi:hypothetical protein